MTLLFADGCDAYAAAADTETGNRWDAASSHAFSTTNGKRGGGCLSMGNAQDGIKSFGSVATTILVVHHG